MKLDKLSPDYVPKIREFGIAKKSGCLFVVHDFIEGQNWQNLNLTDDEKPILIKILSKILSICIA